MSICATGIHGAVVKSGLGHMDGAISSPVAIHSPGSIKASAFQDRSIFEMSWSSSKKEKRETKAGARDIGAYDSPSRSPSSPLSGITEVLIERKRCPTTVIFNPVVYNPTTGVLLVKYIDTGLGDFIFRKEMDRVLELDVSKVTVKKGSEVVFTVLNPDIVFTDSFKDTTILGGHWDISSNEEYLLPNPSGLPFGMRRVLHASQVCGEINGSVVFTISNPEVYATVSSDTHIIFGDVEFTKYVEHEQEDFSDIGTLGSIGFSYDNFYHSDGRSKLVGGKNFHHFGKHFDNQYEESFMSKLGMKMVRVDKLIIHTTSEALWSTTNPPRVFLNLSFNALVIFGGGINPEAKEALGD